MTWFYLDPASGRSVTLPAADTETSTRDFTWMGIRKGGDRWHALSLDDVLGWKVDSYRSFPIAQPLYTTILTVPALPASWNPIGITNDKKGFMVASRDSAAATRDQFSFFDLRGNLIREAVCSDSPDRKHKQVVYLEHDYYVLSKEGEGWRVKVYDASARLIRFFGLAPAVAPNNINGITTDGKALYIVKTAVFGSVVWKFDVRGVLLRTYVPPGENSRFLAGITFNGRYLIVRSIPNPP